MELYSMDNSWTFCPRAGLWWSLSTQHPAQDVLGYLSFPHTEGMPPPREIEAQRGCVQRHLLTGSLPLTRRWGKRNRIKDYSPSPLLSRKYSKHLREAAHFLPQLCMARSCWLSTKRRTPEWGMVMAPAEALGCSQGVFQRLCRKRRWRNTWKSSLSLRADFQSDQYKNTSSVHGFNYSPEPNCFRKWEWSQKMRKLLMDALFTAL